MLYEYGATKKSFYVNPDPSLLKKTAEMYDTNGEASGIIKASDQKEIKAELNSIFQTFAAWAKETHRTEYSKCEFDHCMSQFANFLKSADELNCDTIKCTIGPDRTIWLQGLRNSAMWVVTNLVPKTEEKGA